jgi:hypothetical protein
MGGAMSHAAVRVDGGWACRCGHYLASYRNKAYVLMRDHRASLVDPIRDVLDRSLKTDDCILWPGRIGSTGYGRIGRTGIAHRAVFEARFGPIPDGLHLDHLCRNPPCVHPDHLDPVDLMDNVARGFIARMGFDPRLTCKAGHPRTAENVRPSTGNGRACRPCARARVRERYWRKKAARQGVAA